MRFERSLMNAGVLTVARKEQIEQEIAHSIAQAVKEAEADPVPNGDEAGSGVYAE